MKSQRADPELPRRDENASDFNAFEYVEVSWMSSERQYTIRYFDKNVETINGERIWFDYGTFYEQAAFENVRDLEEKGCVVEMTLIG